MHRPRSPSPVLIAGARLPRAIGLHAAATLVAAAGLAIAAAIPGASLQAQSFLSSSGFGIPTNPVDARARALGGIRVGLFDAALVPTNPAQMAGVILPGVLVSYEPLWGEFTRGEATGDLRSQRFPLIGVMYPVSRIGVISLSFSSAFDLRWAAAEEKEFSFGEGDAVVRDAFFSDGGISVFRVGWARTFGSSLAIGVSGGPYLGDVTRVFRRSFIEGTDVGGPVAPFEARTRWQFSGPTVSLSAYWDPAEFLRFGGAYTWSGTLTAESQIDPDEADVEFEIPDRVEVGASVLVTPRVRAALSVGREDWAGVGGSLDPENEVGTVWSVGTGVEWEGPSLGGRNFPLRLGYSRRGIPIRLDGDDPIESALSFGIGIQLQRIANFPLGQLDLSLERGGRDGGGVDESFWRGAISIRVSGG